jgi:hypothetical protein
MKVRWNVDLDFTRVAAIAEKISAALITSRYAEYMKDHESARTMELFSLASIL